MKESFFIFGQSSARTMSTSNLQSLLSQPQSRIEKMKSFAEVITLSKHFFYINTAVEAVFW
jgi:hypothetical protein